MFREGLPEWETPTLVVRHAAEDVLPWRFGVDDATALDPAERYAGVSLAVDRTAERWRLWGGIDSDAPPPPGDAGRRRLQGWASRRWCARACSRGGRAAAPPCTPTPPPSVTGATCRGSTSCAPWRTPAAVTGIGAFPAPPRPPRAGASATCRTVAAGRPWAVGGRERVGAAAEGGAVRGASRAAGRGGAGDDRPRPSGPRAGTDRDPRAGPAAPVLDERLSDVSIIVVEDDEARVLGGFAGRAQRLLVEPWHLDRTEEIFREFGARANCTYQGRLEGRLDVGAGAHPGLHAVLPAHVPHSMIARRP